MFVFRDKDLMTMLEAGIAGMLIVRRGQRGEIGLVETKIGDNNNTVVTKWDKASEAAILPILLASGLNVRSEEVGFVGNSKRSDLIYVVDPLDGSKPFAIRAMTSTLSVALFDTVLKQVIACVVLEPATGRIWFARKGQGTWCFFYNSNLEFDLREARRCSVWDGQLGAGSIVLVDCYRDFQLAGHPVTSNEVWSDFMGELFSGQSGMYNFGTNCLYYALLACGGNGMAGAVTTCRGGPHDITPVLLALEAGGCAQGYSNKTGVLTEVDPLNVLECNFMLAGNNQDTLTALTSLFKKHLA